MLIGPGPLRFILLLIFGRALILTVFQTTPFAQIRTAFPEWIFISGKPFASIGKGKLFAQFKIV